MKLLAFVCNSFSWTDFKSRLTNLDMWAVPKLEGSNSMLVGVWSTAAGTVATAFHSLPLYLRVVAAQKYIAWLVAIKASAWLSPAPTFVYSSVSSPHLLYLLEFWGPLFGKVSIWVSLWQLPVVQVFTQWAVCCFGMVCFPVEHCMWQHWGGWFKCVLFCIILKYVISLDVQRIES